MRNISTTFAGFWGSFFNRSTLLPAPVPIPAFQTGYVVFRDAQGRPTQTPQWPHITYDIVLPGFMDDTIISASIWNRTPGNPGDMGLVNDVLAQISEAIPTRFGRLSEGITLDCGEDGKIRFMRSNPFIDYLDDPDDNTISRGIVRVVIRNYVP